MTDTPETKTPEWVWLDWMSLYVDDLDRRLTVGERYRMLVALEEAREAASPLLELPEDLASKSERLVAFLTNEAAPQERLIRAAASHLRYGSDVGPLIVR